MIDFGIRLKGERICRLGETASCFCRGLRVREISCAAAILFFFTASASAPSQPLPRNDSERQLFESLNYERASQSLPPLQWDEALFKAARQHALRMSNLNILEHQLPSEPALAERLTEAGARFSVIAENIAIGPNPHAIHSGWMDSPGHRKNILDPRFTSVGIAAVRGTGGLFAVEDFSLSVSNLSLDEQEKKVAALLTGGGWRVNSANEEARKACETDQIEAGMGARTIIRFESADLEKLPAEVEKHLRSKPFRNAEVGACRVRGVAGFARFRIAVLLF
jgi:Cysteine-rich secretory protein family